MLRSKRVVLPSGHSCARRVKRMVLSPGHRRCRAENREARATTGAVDGSIFGGGPLCGLGKVRKVLYHYIYIYHIVWNIMVDLCFCLGAMDRVDCIHSVRRMCCCWGLFIQPTRLGLPETVSFIQQPSVQGLMQLTGVWKVPTAREMCLFFP